MRNYLIVQFLFGCLFASNSYGQDVDVEWQREFTKARSVHVSKSGNRIIRLLSDTTVERIDGTTGMTLDTITLPIKVSGAGFAGESLIVQSRTSYSPRDSLWIVDMSSPTDITISRIADGLSRDGSGIELLQSATHLFVRLTKVAYPTGRDLNYEYTYAIVDSVGVSHCCPPYLGRWYPGDVYPSSVNTINYGTSSSSYGPPTISWRVENPRTGLIETGMVVDQSDYSFLLKSGVHAIANERLYNIKSQDRIPVILDRKRPIAYLGGSKCLVSYLKAGAWNVDLYDFFDGFVGVVDTGFRERTRALVCDSGRAVVLFATDGTRISKLTNFATDDHITLVVHSQKQLTPQHGIVTVSAVFIADVDISRYELRINGSVYSSANGDFRFRHSDLGEHPVRLLAFDVDNRVALDTIVFTINCVRRGNPTDELVPALHRADQDLPTNLEVAPSAGHICISTFDSTTFWQVSRSPLELQRLYTPNAQVVLKGKWPAGWFRSDQDLYDARPRPDEAGGATYYRWNHQTNVQLHLGYHTCALTWITYSLRGGPLYECIWEMKADIRTNRNGSSSLVWYRYNPVRTKEGESYVAFVSDTGSGGNIFRDLRLKFERPRDIDFVHDSLVLLVNDTTIEYLRPQESGFSKSIQTGFERQTCAFYVDSSTILTSTGLYRRGLNTWSLVQRFPFRDAFRILQATPKHVLVLRRNADTIGCVFDIVSQKITSWLGSSHGTPHIAAYARNPKELFVLDSFGVLGVYDMPEEITSYASPDPIEITTRLAPTFLGGALRLRAPNGATAIELYDIHGLLFKRIPLIGVVSDSIEVPVGSMPERSVIAVVVRSPTGVTRHLIMTP